MNNPNTDGCQCNKVTDKEVVSNIQIKQCGDFLVDPNFALIRTTLPSSWTESQCECSVGESINSGNMDNVTFHSDRFEVVVNVKGYEPQEIRCNVTADAVQLVAQHEGSAASGQSLLQVQRNMTMDRSYQLPQTVNPEQAACYLSSDGILVVSAPWGAK